MRLATLISAVMVLMVAGVAPVAAGEVDSFPNGVTVLKWPGSVTNHVNYWENKFPGYDCRKYESNERIVMPAVVGLKVKTIYKGGQWNNVWNYNKWTNNVYGWKNGQKWAFGFSHKFVCTKKTAPKKILRYGGRILGPCGDPFYTARIWNSGRSTRPVAIILEVRGGRTLWKRVLQPGQSIKPRVQWVAGGKTLILRRGNGDIIDRERTVTGTFPWTECKTG